MAKVKYRIREFKPTAKCQAATTTPRRAAAVRLAESWRDDLRDVRCKMEDVRGLTGVGSLLFEYELHELTRIYKEL